MEPAMRENPIANDDAARRGGDDVFRVTVVLITRDRRSELLRTLSELVRLDESPPIIAISTPGAGGSTDTISLR